MTFKAAAVPGATDTNNNPASGIGGVYLTGACTSPDFFPNTNFIGFFPNPNAGWVTYTHPVTVTGSCTVQVSAMAEFANFSIQ
jgi:hypothetical protein